MHGWQPRLTDVEIVPSARWSGAKGKTGTRFTVKICMYAGDYNPPHFHVISAEGSAFMVRLDTYQVLHGTAERRAFALAVAWADQYGVLLAEKWAELNGRD